MNRDKNTETEFMTTVGGSRMATSVGGAITGRGGNFILVDDPLLMICSTENASSS